MPKRALAPLTPADRIRYQLMLCGLTQRGAARRLGLNERTMRKYCSGQFPVPLYIDWAMKGMIANPDEP